MWVLKKRNPLGIDWYFYRFGYTAGKLTSTWTLSQSLAIRFTRKESVAWSLERLSEEVQEEIRSSYYQPRIVRLNPRPSP